jgi:hypothetical protein
MSPQELVNALSQPQAKYRLRGIGSVQLLEPEANQLLAIVEQAGITRSELLRQIVSAWLNEYNKTVAKS